MPYWDNAPAVLASIWGGLFLGGIMLPIYQGVMLAAVDDNLKHKSQALAAIGYNLIGWLPAPVIYGWVCEATGGDKSIWGMVVHLNSIWLTLICIAIGLVAQRNQLNKEAELKEEEEQEEYKLSEAESSA